MRARESACFKLFESADSSSVDDPGERGRRGRWGFWSLPEMYNVSQVDRSRMREVDCMIPYLTSWSSALGEAFYHALFVIA